MDRRKLLQLLTFSGVSATLSVGMCSLSEAIASESGSGWGYTGEGSPENWGDLSSTYTACKTGLQQSPIDLHSAIDANLTVVDVDYKSIPLTILNNGHTIQVNATTGNKIKLDDEEFELLQFHFHHPSEHTVDGKPYPMEMHFVHANSKGELAVLGVFLQEGAENTPLKPVWEAMPQRKGEPKEMPGVKIDISELLPTNREMYRYFGSLTTPPCSEIVKWIVYQEPIQVSSVQIDQFRKIFPLNARPVQLLDRRFILE
ncbi:MAG: carbonic anhydrase [Cyanobacteria bacterium P01_G01_bin.19]